MENIFEKVNIPSNKPFIYLIGESAAKTIISWNDYSGKQIPQVERMEQVPLEL
jgi:hypothetical protein